MNIRRIVAKVVAVSVLVSGIAIVPLNIHAEENSNTEIYQNTEDGTYESGQEMTEPQDTEPDQDSPDIQDAYMEGEEDAPETSDAVEEAAQEENNGISALSEDEEAREELKENSWRYSNGEPLINPMSKETISPNAWKKVNGRYVNSKGDVIPGAQKKGIDVSEHQGKIDWEKVKADGIEFAIIRCGYGDNFTYQDDKQWSYNVSECERLGIPYGVYIYSYATTIEQASSEAEHMLRLLQGHSPSYPVYLDMEDDSTIKAGNEMLGNIAKTFCDKVSASGYRVGIYSNPTWRNNYLTSPVFNTSTWSTWIAQWNSVCTYTGSYDMWQCADNGSVNGISGPVDLNFWMTQTSDVNPITGIDQNIVRYSSHMQTYGWLSEVSNGYQSGVTGYSKRMEAIKINVGEGYGDLGVRYSTYVEGIGWQNYVSNGAVAGTEGQSKSIQAIKIELTGSAAANYDIYYRAHSQTYGWLDWAKNGGAAGTQGYDKRMEAVQIAVVAKGSAAPGSTNTAFVLKPATVSYRTYVAGKGWTGVAGNGDTSGTTGQSKALEAIQVAVDGGAYSGSVKYNTYMQSYRWTGEKQDYAEGGLPGSGKRMEAIKISLTGELAEHYDIYYRVHTQTFGWLGWAKNGEAAGTADYAKRIEAVQIKLVEKGGAAPGSTGNAFRQGQITYITHVQTYGWGTTAYEGQTSGTTGQEKRMEAIKLSLTDTKYQSELQYQVHMQTYGWQTDWTKGGEVAGTTGQSKRLEAIRIKLTGTMAEKYDVYYRVHAQTYGWLGWAKNGESAGTEGLSKRLEAIEVVLVEKGGNAPGDTTNIFVSK